MIMVMTIVIIIIIIIIIHLYSAHIHYLPKVLYKIIPTIYNFTLRNLETKKLAKY